MFLTTEFLIRAIWAVIGAIAKFLCRQADGGVVGADVVRELTHQCLTVVLIGVVLTVAVAITNPGFADAACCRQKAGLLQKIRFSTTLCTPHISSCLLTRVPAAKLDSWITHVRDALAVLLVAHVHAVSVPITTPTHGDAQAIRPTLKLICMTTARRARGCRGRKKIKDDAARL